MKLKEILEKENINIESIKDLNTNKVYIFKILFNEDCSREARFNSLRHLNEVLKADGITSVLIPVDSESERYIKDFQIFELDKEENE